MEATFSWIEVRERMIADCLGEGRRVVQVRRGNGSGVIVKFDDVFDRKVVECGFMRLFDEVVEAFDDWVEFVEMVFVRVFAVIVELAFEDAEFDSIKRFGTCSSGRVRFFRVEERKRDVGRKAALG